MKRKAAVLLLTGAVAAMMAGTGVQAETYGYSWEGENGPVSYFVTGKQGEVEIRTEMESEIGSQMEAESEPESSVDSLTEQEQELWHRTQMQESLAYLNEYGVTYDKEQDVIWYRGKTVRWLIDQQIDGGCYAYEMPEGEIDVYTVRDETFQLTGVREASKEEYDEKTRQDAQAEALSKDGVRITLVEELNAVEVPGSGDGSIVYSIEGDVAAQADEVILSDDSIQCTTDIAENVEVEVGKVADTAEDVLSTEMSMEAVKANGTAVEVDVAQGIMLEATAAESAVTEGQILEETKKRREDYQAAGIGCDDNGGWTWNGKKVFWLVDEDGSVYQNGEARDGKIYILVKRDADGSITEAKQITAEEVMKERIARFEESESGKR